MMMRILENNSSGKARRRCPGESNGVFIISACVGQCIL